MPFDYQTIFRQLNKAGVDYLIAMEVQAGRKQDLSDVEHLRMILEK